MDKQDRADGLCGIARILLKQKQLHATIFGSPVLLTLYRCCGADHFVHHSPILGWGACRRQLMGGIWLALMTFAHLATCPSINTLKSVCVIVIGVAPVFSQASLISGRDAILVISWLSLSTIGCGVPAGAMKPTQRVALKPATPASAIVGTSGRIGDRVFPVVPRARTRPALIIGAMVGTESNSIWICPLRMSFRAPVEPL